MDLNYLEFIARKTVAARSHGLREMPVLNPVLFGYQKTVTEFALRQGRAALFLDTGLGKTVSQLEWARCVPGKVLILAPVAVAPQTVREGREKLGLDVHHSRDGSAPGKVTITNYERVHLFDVSQFDGVVLDESSILKSMTGKTKIQLCSLFAQTPFRLACSATPAPNDWTELGNHSDFLGIMPQNEMLARWFVNDSSDTGTWRIKGHAIRSFWEWVASWGACVSKPSDAGGNDDLHRLPPLTTRLHTVESELIADVDSGTLFGGAELSATSMHADKRQTLKQRVDKVAELVATKDFALVWCETNDESAALAKAIPDSVEVKGSDDPDEKEAKLDAFSRRQIRVMVTKPSIAGFGLNWQHCNHVVFASLSYSYESFYQAIRRTWRFGQTRPVTVDVVIASSENNIWRTVKEKLGKHDEMKEAMKFARFSATHSSSQKVPYVPQHSTTLPSWLIAA